MKGEYTENQDHHHNHNAHHSIFSKFQPPHLHSQPQPQPHPPKFQSNLHPHHYNPFPLTTTTTLKDSEEADSAATTTTPTTQHQQPPSKKSKTSNTATTATSEDGGGTIEVARRPRGRPPGSKNKPKPPIVITREPEPAMAPYILEVPGGSDIVDSLTRFTRRRGIGLCVLTASGAVANVSLKQPSTSAPAGTVTFHGRFDILSLSAVLLLPTVPLSNSSGGSGNSGNNNNGVGNSNNAGYGFTISLAGPQGQIVGGKVVGPLLAAGTVYIIAASFCSPSYHRLPLDQDHHHQQHFHNQNQNPSSVSGGGGERQSSSPVSGGGGGGESSGGGGGVSGPMGMYSCHMGSDVIWAPTARPPF